MSNICNELHKLFNSITKHKFPFDKNDIPENGIYILYQKGEYGHGSDRIVRIGTHTGDNQLRSRLVQHFINENKDRSIFRKNIGRCFLNKANDPYLKIWELDFTTREEKDKSGHLIDNEYQQMIEKQINEYIQDNFSFCVIEVNEKEERLELESKMISTVSLCKECITSKDWLGLYSPVEKIRESGLWQVNELYKEPLNEDEIRKLKEMIV
jgi:hypothetical protein